MTDLIKTEDETIETPVPDELEQLKARADLIGVKYHTSISAEKLRAKIKAHLDGVEEKPVVEAVEATTEETVGQRRRRMKEEATALVRVNIMCLNPAKKEWDGEIISVGNASLNTITKFVPFNTVDGYHIPRIMYQMLLDRQCTYFYTEKTPSGQGVRKSRLGKEFNIEVLPLLTKAELAELAKVQAAAGIIG